MPDSPKLSDEFDQNGWDAADWAEHLLDGSNPEVRYENSHDRVLSAQPDSGSYSGDWTSLASALKQRRSWTCEVCRFVLLNSSLIHAHHVNGIKSDNGIANLQVLCAVCHGKKHSWLMNFDGRAPEADVAKLMAWRR